MTVKSFNNGSWQQIGSASSRGSGYPSLYVYNGVPYVFYEDMDLNKEIIVAYE
jgi:hypothetical protein